MRTFVAAMTSIFLIASASLTTPAIGRAQSSEDIEKEIVRLENEWRRARIKGDIAFLEALYATDLRITGTDGSVKGRDADISLFASGTLKPESIEHEDMRVFVYGDAAVAIGVDRFKGTYRGNYGEGAYRFTHVFARLHGRWQLVASQGTSLQPR